MSFAFRGATTQTRQISALEPFYHWVVNSRFCSNCGIYYEKVE